MGLPAPLAPFSSGLTYSRILNPLFAGLKHPDGSLIEGAGASKKGIIDTPYRRDPLEFYVQEGTGSGKGRLPKEVAREKERTGG